ncbi:TetR/AcrR family transcriptional regulator [Ferdinandcohnia quinoae]|uniref:TetR/AcrR family transcriptional regulator n=1 Tax=Fredinandcohnia quinoae TaxID=2918902 RepID=A0AAW5E865_9BACI|nr:TetR/AcrR family transcriptional regulator [Fredinandcohnia sp. SECRCQ15]MCH1627109.1 TetR/AcrR family transcriptional regulator [Fredinandcohnia sp. SECRCQ15]
MARERKFSTDELFQETKQLLLQNGYEGFTFSLLADRLNVARGTLYKYYENRDELITDYMIYEMKQFLTNLKVIHEYRGFTSQFDFLLDFILMHHEVPQMIGIARHIPIDSNEKVKANRATLDQLHLDMYTQLGAFIQLGRDERLLKPTIPDGLILGMIFQTIAIPNHSGVPQSEWIQSIKEIISHGMFTNI